MTGQSLFSFFKTKLRTLLNKIKHTQYCNTVYWKTITPVVRLSNLKKKKKVIVRQTIKFLY